MNSKSFSSPISVVFHPTPSPPRGESLPRTRSGGRGEGPSSPSSLRMAAIFATLFVPVLLTACTRPDPLASLSCSPESNTPPPVPSSAYHTDSIPELKAKADAGDLAAARVMGERYEYGDGIGVDIDKAVKWYERGAIVKPPALSIFMPGYGKIPASFLTVNGQLSSAGDILAIAHLAFLYRTGEGIQADPVKANVLSSCVLTRAASSLAKTGMVQAKRTELDQRNLNRG